MGHVRSRCRHGHFAVQGGLIVARLVINSNDFSERLKGFMLSCTKCASPKVTLDIDWAAYPSAAWMDISVICETCKHDETLVAAC